MNEHDQSIRRSVLVDIEEHLLGLACGYFRANLFGTNDDAAIALRHAAIDVRKKREKEEPK